MNNLARAMGGRYFSAGSLVHRLDARCKLAATAIFLPLPFLVSGWGLAAVLAAVCGAAVLAQVKLRYLAEGLRPLLYVFIFTVLIHALAFGGDDAGGQSLGPIVVSKSGFVDGIYFALRLAILVLGTSILTMTTTSLDLTSAIEFVISPLAKVGLPSAEIALLLGLSFRFVPGLMDETARIIRAQTARGADFSSGGMVARGRVLMAIFIPLFVGTIRKAKGTAMAMESRGYDGGPPRSRLQTLSWRWADTLGLGLAIAMAMTILVLCK